MGGSNPYDPSQGHTLDNYIIYTPSPWANYVYTGGQCYAEPTVYTKITQLYTIDDDCWLPPEPAPSYRVNDEESWLPRLREVERFRARHLGPDRRLRRHF